MGALTMRVQATLLITDPTQEGEDARLLQIEAGGEPDHVAKVLHKALEAFEHPQGVTRGRTPFDVIGKEEETGAFEPIRKVAHRDGQGAP